LIRRSNLFRDTAKRRRQVGIKVTHTLENLGTLSIYFDHRL